MNVGPFGWIPPAQWTAEQHEANERILAGMKPFFLRGGYYSRPQGRFALWKFCQQVNGGKHIAYVHQLTGSCVGAGGSNMLRTLGRVEIAQGEPEQWPGKEIWWPYTYGQSRRLAGIGGQGEGSFGSAWAQAIVEAGDFAQDEVPNLPAFDDDGEGWLQLSRSIELQWSNGAAYNKEPFLSAGRRHLVRSASPVRSSEEAAAALANGYPLTIASNFGTHTIQPRGNPAINVATWDDTWPHQMYVDEAWDHPSLGLVFRIGNNWGPSAHPAPTQGEPPGGFYVTAATFDKITASRDCECFAFSKFEGFPVRTLDWLI